MTNTTETLDTRVTHVQGGTEQDGARFHHAAQNSTQCKTYEFFVSGIFHLILSDCE